MAVALPGLQKPHAISHGETGSLQADLRAAAKGFIARKMRHAGNNQVLDQKGDQMVSRPNCKRHCLCQLVVADRGP